MTDTQSCTAREFVMFSLNFPHNFIKQAWTGTDNEWVIDHLQDKFDQAYEDYGASAAMTVFYARLDNTNQKILEDYIKQLY